MDYAVHDGIRMNTSTQPRMPITLMILGAEYG
jgi:hypothetical protein